MDPVLCTSSVSSVANVSPPRWALMALLLCLLSSLLHRAERTVVVAMLPRRGPRQVRSIQDHVVGRSGAELRILVSLPHPFLLRHTGHHHLSSRPLGRPLNCSLEIPSHSLHSVVHAQRMFIRPPLAITHRALSCSWGKYKILTDVTVCVHTQHLSFSYSPLVPVLRALAYAVSSP